MWRHGDCSARYIPFVSVLYLNCVELQTEEFNHAEAVSEPPHVQLGASTGSDLQYFCPLALTI